MTENNIGEGFSFELNLDGLSSFGPRESGAALLEVPEQLALVALAAQAFAFFEQAFLRPSAERTICRPGATGDGLGLPDRVPGQVGLLQDGGLLGPDGGQRLLQ